MAKKITIKDVAKEARVSVTMVSRVLNNYGSFSEESKSKVLKAVEKLNYRPDAIARSLKTKQTKVIGIVVSDVQTSLFTSLIRGVEDIGSQSGYSVILCNADEETAKEREYLSVLSERGVDGLIISPCPGNYSYIKKLVRGGTPVALVDRRIKGLDVPTVIVDNEIGAHQAVNYLIRLGHCRIGIICGLKGVMTSEERLAGYKRSLEEHHLPIDPELIKWGDYRLEKARQKTAEFLKMKNPPPALFVANSTMVQGTLLALREHKVKIPEEISIIAFDDSVWASLMNPALTTVSLPGYSMGVLACQALLKETKGLGGNKTEEIVLKTKLIVRGSCKERIPEKILRELA